MYKLKRSKTFDPKNLSSILHYLWYFDALQTRRVLKRKRTNISSVYLGKFRVFLFLCLFLYGSTTSSYFYAYTIYTPAITTYLPWICVRELKNLLFMIFSRKDLGLFFFFARSWRIFSDLRLELYFNLYAKTYLSFSGNETSQGLPATNEWKFH